MLWKHSYDSDTHCGVVVDVSSGSVGVALVVINRGTREDKIIWSHREYSLLRTSSTLAESERKIKTTIINAFLELGSSGLKALHTFEPTLRVQKLLVSIAAPYEYTTTKLVHLVEEKGFTVDKKLLKDLSELASKQAETQAKESGLLNDFGLSVIHQEHLGITVNGYHTKDPYDKKTTDLSFTHLTSLAVTSITEAIVEAQEKIIPTSTLTMQSFMTVLYKSIDALYPHTLEACLISVTSEATEMGIVRDGALLYVNHIPIGSFTLARTIADALSIPTEEAFTYLKANTEYGIASIPESKQAIIKQIFDSYNEKIAELLKKTGDELSIPQAIFVHTEKSTSSFFTVALKQSAKSVTSIDHTIHPVTPKLVGEAEIDDSAILLGVRYFHDIVTDTQ
jgi:hypothetical protein